MKNSKKRTGIIAGSAVAALALIGMVGATVANAADSTPSPKASSSQSGTESTRPVHTPEEELTGDAATQVKAAVEAKYPGATIDRMEKDSDGKSVYEAHITKADGTHVTVMLDASYAITGEDTMGPGGHGKGGPDGARGSHTPEEELTGDAATQVKAAVEAKYPGATIDRMEKDSDGKSVYEAHITKADGTHVTVMLDASYTITGEDTMGPGGHGKGGPGKGGPGTGGRHGAQESGAAQGSASTTQAG